VKKLRSIKDGKLRDAILSYYEENLEKIPVTRTLAPIMDLYTISRILRDFDVSADARNSKAFRGTAENVIYIAGSAHIVNMVHFFEYIGLKPELVAGSDFETYKFPGYLSSVLPIDLKKTSFLVN